MSPAASRNDASSALASCTSASSITSGYGGRPGSCWMPTNGKPPTSPACVSPMCRSLHSTIENRNRPGGGCGAVKLYGPPVVSPKSDVPTALPVTSVNGVGVTTFPCRAGLVVVGAPRFETGQLDVVVRRVPPVTGDAMQTCRARTPPHLAVGGRGLHPPEPVVGTGVTRVPRDDGAVLGERDELEVHRRDVVASVSASARHH